MTTTKPWKSDHREWKQKKILPEAEVMGYAKVLIQHWPEFYHFFCDQYFASALFLIFCLASVCIESIIWALFLFLRLFEIAFNVSKKEQISKQSGKIELSWLRILDFPTVEHNIA